MINKLITQCFESVEEANNYLIEKRAIWSDWIKPISESNSVGEDPNYDDKFEQLKEEVNRLTGADTDTIIQLSEELIKETSKDLRVITYYIWARLYRDGEIGFGQGLTLLCTLLDQFDKTLLPKREISKITAVEWLNSNKIMDTFSMYPEINKEAFKEIVAATFTIIQQFSQWEESSRPNLTPLVNLLDTRLSQTGGFNASVPQSTSPDDNRQPVVNPNSSDFSTIKEIQSGRELLDQAKELCKYLIKQENGWLSSSKLMRALRWDTVHQLPPADADGKTKLIPPRQEFRQKLKRLYLGKQWLDLLEQVEMIFAQGANHFWLDLQWYTCQALQNLNSPYDNWHEIFCRDLKGLLERLYGLEHLLFNDGTPFADHTTLAWLNQKILEEAAIELPNAVTNNESDNSVLMLESEAVKMADADGIEKALQWLGTINHAKSDKDKFLLKLIMARLSEQYGKNELAIHLLNDLAYQVTPSDPASINIQRQVNLAEWEPEIMFEVYAKLLKLTKQKYARDNDKAIQNKILEPIIAMLIKIDPIRACVLC